MEKSVCANEDFVLELIDRYTSAHPDTPIIGLSAMPVDANKIVKDKADIIPVREEFILRAREMRKKNSGKMLTLMEKRIISNK